MRTRMCTDCGSQVRATIHEVQDKNLDEMYDLAGRTVLSGDMGFATINAVLRFKCHCDYVDVPVSGDAKAFDVPATWGE